MSQWIRFEDGRSRALPEHATILKDGRLIIKNEIAVHFGLKPGTMVELYHAPDNSRIGIKPVTEASPYAIKCAATCRKDHPFNEPVAEGKGKPSLAISVRGFLNSRHIGLSTKVKGKLYVDPESGLIVFEFASAPEPMSATEHVRKQLVKRSLTPQVVGDQA